MNILIIGLGSIGQRHLRNLKLIEPKAKFYALRKKNTKPLLNNSGKVIKGEIKKKYSLNYIRNLDEIIIKKINIGCAFVCTPNALHISQVTWLVKNNINCFVEKPLSSSLRNIGKLERLLKKKDKLISMMGFQLRFNPIMHYLENIFKKKSPIGNILIFNAHHGEHIADQQPYENYADTYSARKDLGGGVILNQSHEWDYMLNLFTNYKYIKTSFFSSKLSNLNMNVENVFTGSFLLKKDHNKMLCTINLNYLERPKKWKINLIGEKGSIEICLNTNKICVFKEKKKIIKKFKFKKNDIYLKEVKFFISKIKSKKQISNDLNLLHGIKVLKFALELKKNFK